MGRTFSVVPVNLRDSGFRAVATTMSPRERTSSTRCFPKPVEVPVMKKTRGMIADFVCKRFLLLFAKQTESTEYEEERKSEKFIPLPTLWNANDTVIDGTIAELLRVYLRVKNYTPVIVVGMQLHDVCNQSKGGAVGQNFASHVVSGIALRLKRCGV